MRQAARGAGMSAPTICSTAGQPVSCCLTSPRPVVAGGLFPNTTAADFATTQGAADMAGGAPAPRRSSALAEASKAGALLAAIPRRQRRPGSSLLDLPRGACLGGLFLRSGCQPLQSFRPRHLGAIAPFGGHGTAAGGAGVPSAASNSCDGKWRRFGCAGSARCRISPTEQGRTRPLLNGMHRPSALDPITASSGRDPLAAGCRRLFRIVAPGLQLAGGLTGPDHAIPCGGQGRHCPAAPGVPGKSERPVVLARPGGPHRQTPAASSPGAAAVKGAIR